jgi:hypothetical protein
MYCNIHEHQWSTMDFHSINNCWREKQQMSKREKEWDQFFLIGCTCQDKVVLKYYGWSLMKMLVLHSLLPVRCRIHRYKQTISNVTRQFFHFLPCYSLVKFNLEGQARRCKRLRKIPFNRYFALYRIHFRHAQILFYCTIDSATSLKVLFSRPRATTTV